MNPVVNLGDVSKRRRAATHCQRGHNNWGWSRREPGKPKRRYCRDCKNENDRNRRHPKVTIHLPRAVVKLRIEEVAVIQAAADGLNVKQAAEKLHYTTSSIVHQRQRVFRKLGVDNIAHAVAIAFRYGIIS